MKEKIFLFAILLFVSCKNNLQNTDDSKINIKKEIPSSLTMITVIPKGGTADVTIQGKQYRLTPFKLAQWEVTCGLWKEVFEYAEKNGYKFLSKGLITEDNIPVTNISWYDAIVWCNALSEKTKRTPVYRSALGAIIKDATEKNICSLAVVLKTADGFRLPSEGEWEFAARGGNPDDLNVWNYIYAGGNNLKELGWYKENSGGELKPAGLKKANSLGLYDMSGNVWEWCWNWYNQEETVRINRGGGILSPAENCKTEQNGSNFPHITDKTLGFRLAENAE